MRVLGILFYYKRGLIELVLFNLFIGILAVLAYPDMLLPEEIQTEFIKPMASSKPKIGKGNSLLYALVVSIFLGWQSIDISRTRDDGWSFRSKHVPVEILTPCLVFMGLALGINVSEAITSIALAVTQNSIAIRALLNKNNISQTDIEIAKSEEEDGNEKI